MYILIPKNLQVNLKIMKIHQIYENPGILSIRKSNPNNGRTGVSNHGPQWRPDFDWYEGLFSAKQPLRTSHDDRPFEG